MNHNCYGYYWPSLRKYRCLKDGTVLSGIGDNPAFCPHCGRPAHAITLHNAQERIVIVREIYTPDYGFVEESREIKDV